MSNVVRKRSWRRRFALGGLLVGLLQSAGPTHAQEEPPPAAPPPPATATPAIDATFKRVAPRTAVTGFLEACWAGDYVRATEYLDLRRVAAVERETEGQRLARQMCHVLDRALWVDPEQLSDDPAGARDDGLSARRDLVGTIQTAKAPVTVEIERVPGENGAAIWKLSQATVAKIPGLYDEFGYGPVGERLPAWMVEKRLWRVPVWEWIGLLVLMVTVTVLALVLSQLLHVIVKAIVARTETRKDDRVWEVVRGPVRLLVGVALFRMGTALLAFSFSAQRVITAITDLLLLAAFTWVLVRVVDVAAHMAEERYVGPRKHIASLIPLVRRTSKGFVVVMAVLAVLQNIGYDVSSLIAGLGIGGLAVALAAQKTVEHVFGSVTIITDQPVRVGDFCRFGSWSGTVEEVGLRSTRVRTLDRTVVSVPNAQFSSLEIENFSQRDRIRLIATIGLRYETSPDQLRFVLVEIKRLLLAHPKLDPQPARVRFVGFGPHSLDIEIFAYVLTTDFDEFLAIREDIYLRIMEVVSTGGSGFAFPSQTVYWQRDGGLDRARAEAAERQVEAWRAAEALWLPTVPVGEATAARGSIEYPPAGSAARKRV
ncbi:mechanosensitive ion channel family protein [Candidatus Binatia bacterium]|nr:mechanosensitive ion channel family protein [Candidatus Binatia bacterium]